jgi:hypothetical protein
VIVESKYFSYSNFNNSHEIVTPPSSSRRKLSPARNLYEEFYDESVDCRKLKTGYQLVDIKLLSETVRSFVQCKYYKNADCVSVLENVDKCKGLASSLVISAVRNTLLSHPNRLQVGMK